MSRPVRIKWFLLILVGVFVGPGSLIVRAQSQNPGGAGQNINVITGSEDQFTGDKFRQRQNESMIAVSSINPAHMMVVYNDARTVDYPDDPSTGSQSPAQGFVAKVLDFLRAPPGNRLELLAANRRGQHSVRINDQYRICFVWTESGPEQVEIFDYH